MKINKHKRGGFYTTLSVRGKKKFIYGATEEEVEAKYIDMKYKIGKGYNVTDNPSLEEYMVTWFNTFKKGKGSLSTQNMYRNCINVHINPALGTKKVKDITSTDVQALLNNITSSKSLAHKVKITLNQIFKQAIADRLISFNPVDNCSEIAPDEPKRAYLTQTQRSILLDVLKNHRFYPVMFTILYSGMRMGEALALTWNDIDFHEKVIKVTKATEYDHAKPIPKDPKTKKGFREIPLPKELYDYLKLYKKKSKKNIYVFPGHAGGPMGLTEITRIIKSARKQVNRWFNRKENESMKDHNFHITFRLLRHTYCTGLFDAGIDELSAAEIMGHDVSIMREIYTHISEARKKKTAAKLDALYQDNVVEFKETK